MSRNMVNAWIFLNEDEPAGSTYDSPDSCYQRLIQDGVYKAVDLLSMCFVETVPTAADTVPAGDGSSYTIRMGAYAHNQPYMENIIRDAPASNPDILLGVTLVWGDADELSQIFPDPQNPDTASAQAFAANLVAYLQHYGLREFCIDWESPLCDATSKQQFALLINAIGAEFAKQSEKLYLTLAPASVGNLDAAAVNDHVDWVTLQLYSGFTSPQDYIDAGVNKALFAYGAKFESNYQTAQQAVADNTQNYGYPIYTNWRLNSSNYVFEQDQQVQLHQLVFPGAAAG